MAMGDFEGFPFVGGALDLFSHPADVGCFVVFQHHTDSDAHFLLFGDVCFEIKLCRRSGCRLFHHPVVSVLHVEDGVAHLAEQHLDHAHLLPSLALCISRHPLDASPKDLLHELLPFLEAFDVGIETFGTLDQAVEEEQDVYAEEQDGQLVLESQPVEVPMTPFELFGS